jgi:pimeloyl-ACP methyl ester carboxylesterase
MSTTATVTGAVSRRFVDVSGLRMHVAEAGAGQPVVLLHTVFQHGDAWREVIPRLAGRFRVICPDLRGCGWTDAPRRGYDKEALAADVLGLLDALGIDRAAVVGHSLGGFLGFLLALRHPDRVKRLVALGVGHPWPRPRDTLPSIHRNWYQAVAALGRGRGARAVAPWVLRGTSPTPEAWPDDRVWAYTARLADPRRAQAVSAMYRSLLGRELLSILRGRYRDMRLGPPTLLVVGSRDYFFPISTLSGWEPYAEDLRLEVVGGAGHFLPDEEPALVSATILRFLGGVA